MVGPDRRCVALKGEGFGYCPQGRIIRQCRSSGKQRKGPERSRMLAAKLDSLDGGRVGFVASREANLFW